MAKIKVENTEITVVSVQNEDNPNFNCTEFDTIRNAEGSNNFVLSVKAWMERTGAIGIMAKAWRYGGTYAHRDIAYHFGMWNC